MMAKMKSVWASGRKPHFSLLAPSPTPVTPPDAMPISDCHTWKPASCLCWARSRNASHRSRR